MAWLYRALMMFLIRLAAGRENERLQPLLDLHGLHVRQSIALPAWQNPWYCQLLHFDMAGLRRLTQNYDDREVEHLMYVLKTCA
jgi:hypothetical protein